MSEFRMPSLGADMDAGTLTEWYVQPGDHVQRGQIVAAVETMKGIIEIEVFSDGRVDQLLIEPGKRVPVGTPLALIADDAEHEKPARAEEVEPKEPPRAPETPRISEAPKATARKTAQPEPTAPPRASPSARRRAKELGIDLSTLKGTGHAGAIRRQDVDDAATIGPAPAATPAPSVQPPQRAPATDMRRAIALAMARSKREIPHYYVKTTIDLSRALAWLETANERRSVTERILPSALLLKAVARALRKVPELNGFYRDDRFEPSEPIHIGMAVALREGGLVAPAIHDVDHKAMPDLMADLADLVTRARSGRLRHSEMIDPTITVTSLGDRGVEEVIGIIYPPQVALVGFGKVVKRPWVVDGDALAVRPVITATLSADHRVSDGHRGGLFLDALERALQSPEEL